MGLCRNCRSYYAERPGLGCCVVGGFRVRPTTSGRKCFRRKGWPSKVRREAGK